MKGFKDFFFGAYVEAVAVVRYADEGVIAARPETFSFFLVVFFEGDFDRAAPLGQAVPGLDAEFDDGLLHLRGISQHGGAISINVGEQLHFGRDNGLEDSATFFDDGLETERLQHGRGALGKFAELMNEIAGAVAGFKNLFERFAAGMVFGQIERDEFGTAENAGDEVIEFVCDSGGQFIEREELLVLEQFAFGGVFGVGRGFHGGGSMG